MHDVAQQVYTLAEAAVAVADAEVVEKGGGFLAPVVGVLEAVLKVSPAFPKRVEFFTN
jgi:hypothetical protein